MFGQCPRAPGVALGDGFVQGQELDLMILVGPFQLRIFCGMQKSGTNKETVLSGDVRK